MEEIKTKDTPDIRWRQMFYLCISISGIGSTDGKGCVVKSEFLVDKYDYSG